MKRADSGAYGLVHLSRFPLHLFGLTFGGLVLASGLHVGLIVLLSQLALNQIILVHAVLLYWILVSLGLTLLIRHLTKNTYEKPMKELASATRKVAEGDFTVYVPPLHTADEYDYLDVMILDFNKMVEGLGSVETLKTDFFANVSHEIKTPLAVIQNTAELLKNEELSPEQRAEYVDTIEKYARRLADLITNILKLNKLEKQTIQPKPEPYNLCAQLAECALLFEDRWEQKNLEFEAELEDEAVIEADESLLELVWNNLLSNAVKFTEPGGTITLRQTSGDGWVEVTVSDTGCGMDDNTLQHIFDKFYQGDTSHSTEGNGLGLALVLRIVRMMGGSISVESKTGEGSAFTVRLPAPRNKEPGEHPPVEHSVF